MIEVVPRFKLSSLKVSDLIRSKLKCLIVATRKDKADALALALRQGFFQLFNKYLEYNNSERQESKKKKIRIQGDSNSR